jgi:hypothetical protein
MVRNSQKEQAPPSSTQKYKKRGNDDGGGQDENSLESVRKTGGESVNTIQSK